MQSIEICEFIDSSQYNEIITKIFNEIEGAGCRIMPQEQNDTRSSHSFPLEGKPYMRIYFGDNHPRKDVPLRILWDMFHEYGHFLSGPPVERSLPIPERDRREILAWKRGLVKAIRYFKNPEISSFQEYGNYCLKTYSIPKIRPDEWLEH